MSTHWRNSVGPTMQANFFSRMSIFLVMDAHSKDASRWGVNTTVLLFSTKYE